MSTKYWSVPTLITSGLTVWVICWSILVRAQSHNFSCSQVNQIPEVECQALVVLYNSTDGPHWVQFIGGERWLTSTTPCSWFGVVCSQQHVTELFLVGVGLRGDVPAELANLSNLEKLDLGGDLIDYHVCNHLQNIPASLGKLTFLQRLNLSCNDLRSIPAELGALTNLRELDLSYNHLEDIPLTLAGLTDLQLLNLSNNQLTRYPNELTTFPKLQQFHLAANQLRSLPPELGQLTSLYFLFLNDNLLESITPELERLQNLRGLGLSGNQLTTIPGELGALTSLTGIDLDENHLTSLPAEVGKLSNLNSLKLRNNHLHSLPPELTNLSKLVELDLGLNEIISLPPEIGNLSSLNYLYLDSNRLTMLPAELGGLTQLDTLNLTNNQLTSLPSALGNLVNLRNFLLNDNPDLRGAIPQKFINLTRLSGFGYSNTNLCEPATVEFQNWLTGITALSRNGFTCLKLRPNYITGTSGSQFIITGSEFPTLTVKLSVNGIKLGVVEPDVTGKFTATLGSDEAIPGTYVINADVGASVSTVITIAKDSLFHMPIGASDFTLPPNAAYNGFIYLSLVTFRSNP